MPSVTLAELQAELQLMGLPETTDGQTAREWAETWDCTIHVARKMIKQCIHEGKMTATHGLRHDMAGRPCDVPIYLLVESKPRKQRARAKNA